MENLDINFTFFIQLANAIITLVVLNYLLIKPIREQIKVRDSLMTGYLADIEHFTSLAEAKLSAYKAVLDEARQEALTSRDSLKAAGHGQEQAILASAQANAQALIKASRNSIATDTKKAFASLSDQVPAFAAQAALRILG